MSVFVERSAAAVVVRANGSTFAFWDPSLNREVEATLSADKSLEFGDWICVIRGDEGSLLDYEKVELPAMKTQVDNNGELNIHVKAFVPPRDFAKTHHLQNFLLSPNLGRIIADDSAFTDLLNEAENEGRGFSIEVIGSMNLAERTDKKTMWIVRSIIKRKKMSEAEKSVCMEWFTKKNNSEYSDEDLGSQYASIMKFQKTRVSSNSSFENVASQSMTSVSSFSIISSQRTPPLSPDDSNTTLGDDSALMTEDVNRDLEPVGEATKPVPTEGDEIVFLHHLHNILNNPEFEEKFQARFPEEYANICASYLKYEYLLA
ncbi:hypothetical protein QR680_013028 [Steinernema hermaphroditum]|uniref:Uncharacterized protein n=1 Tax=Steinernema hermaphroditum TaxID=289476 RepID=A0AA39M1K8_9BILA|nr:hypothetical protein QR680_013028 [Steinernema hermaphroditum]